MTRTIRLALVVLTLPLLLLALVPVVVLARYAGPGYLLAALAFAGVVVAWFVLRRRRSAAGLTPSEGVDRYSSLETL